MDQTLKEIEKLLPPRTPLAKLYFQHLAALGLSMTHGDPDGGAERQLTHMGVISGIVGAARTLLDAETFEAFKADTGLDQNSGRLSSHMKDAFNDLPPL